ncbi:MAG: hypothetical protein JNL74_11980 [Fibrobacteres bacterium]|nr:hypothetical protein [Fibrobacterota bacterium]
MRIGYVFITELILSLVIGGTFYAFDIPAVSGFNPSDDGMVVAQSYRILNGEIPHRDFIAMRPVLSAYMHLIDFYLPLSLFENGRVVMMAELFIAALLWGGMLYSLGKDTRCKLYNCIFLFAVTLITFVLNLNTFMPYPWTTTDGLFLGACGASLYIYGFRSYVNLPDKKSFALICSGALLIGMAALCKQNFLPLSIIAIMVFALHERKINLKMLILIIVTIIPLFLYCIYFIWNGAALDLVRQLSGRRSLAGPGVMSYIEHFYQSKLFVFHVLVLFGSLALSTNTSSEFINSRKGILVKRIIVAVYLLTALFSIVTLFQGREYYNPAFELFYIVLVLLTSLFLFKQLSTIELVVGVFALGLAWCGSISGGMNSPLLGSGFLMAAIMWYSIKVLSENAVVWNESMRLKSNIGLLVVSVLIFALSIKGKLEFNYRDRQSSELTHCLGNVDSVAFGNIKTNETTHKYMRSIKAVLDSNPRLVNRSVFLPNHCALYPAFRTANPFPLEWNDRWEFLNIENDYYARCQKATMMEDTYLFVDKINAEGMADSLVPMNYDKWLHGNIVDFVRGAEVVAETEFFIVYKVGQTGTGVRHGNGSPWRTITMVERLVIPAAKNP